MNSDPPAGTAGRPARADEIEPSEDMREADRANGEPDATTGDDESTLVTDDPDAPPAPATPDEDIEARRDHESTLVTDDPGPPGHPASDPGGDRNR